MRRPLLAGNWKMNYGRLAEASAFLRQIRHPLSEIESADIVLCPPFTVLVAFGELLTASPLSVGAQNMHWEDGGAYTGEVSPSMLAEVCEYVILGHSERRGVGCRDDNDAGVNRKVVAGLKYDLTPILCVGEDLSQNEAGQTHTFVAGQVRSGLASLTPQQVAKCVIAYEPIWAIGTGRAATPADVNRVIGLTIRGTLADEFGERSAQAVRVLYGGSVTRENIESFMRMPEVDGALVGGASLKPDFVELVRLAARAGG